MKTRIASPSLVVASSLAAVLIVSALFAAEHRSARVTEVIRDVHLLAARAAARPAAMNDAVNEGTAVRTGADSRAELTFADQTITRVGANTVLELGQLWFQVAVVNVPGARLGRGRRALR